MLQNVLKNLDTSLTVEVKVTKFRLGQKCAQCITYIIGPPFYTTAKKLSTFMFWSKFKCIQINIDRNLYKNLLLCGF